MKKVHVPLRIRDAVLSDADFLFALANDPSVRAMSHNQQSILYEEHLAWFANALSEQISFYIGEYSDRACAYVRFNIQGDVHVVSMALHKDFRGQGLAKHILRLACQRFFSTTPATKVHARIKAVNMLSLRTFFGVGFLAITSRHEREMLLECVREEFMSHQSTYIIAEVSANHMGSIERAESIICEAAKAGANAVKLQTYTAGTLTLDCDAPIFQAMDGGLWEGRTLHDIYAEGTMPWEWTPRLMACANDLGIECFSTPFDVTAVDFLESCGVSRYKIASFELVDMPLLKKVAATRKPVIMSTGMGTLAEIDEAVRTLRDNGCTDITLLKCTSSYPAPVDEANLRTIPHMATAFQCSVGLSDHTMGSAVAVAAIALGATVIEKHFTLARTDGGLDAAFSMEPHELKAMVQDIRIVEKALGRVSYDRTEKEQGSVCFRRSLFVVQDVQEGEAFTHENVRSIRPGHGIHTRYIETILGKKATRSVSRGTPFSWDFV